MKERPILCSDSLVKPIIARVKTQTRRPVVLPKGYEFDGIGSDAVGPSVLCSRPSGSTGERRIRCPYGAPRDRLWVRETWGYQPATLDDERLVAYRATVADPPGWPSHRGPYAIWIKWRPSIHMPRWASRLTLEIERVRVQRLQDISDEDAAAEGLSGWQRDPLTGLLHGRCQTVQQAFAQLWESIYGRRPALSWADNPLVWAITFRAVLQQSFDFNTQSHEAPR